MTASEPTGVILLVDDQPANLAVLFDYLSVAACKVLVAQDGESALVQARRTIPDLILLDILMPGLDGYQTCARLQECPETRDIPVIFMTALSEVQDKVRAFAVGGVDYVTKPFQQEEVLARVRTHLRLRRLQQALQARNEALQREIEAHQRARATVRYLADELRSAGHFQDLVGASAALKALLEQVDLVADTDSTVLILGETGTGKELIARALHQRGRRREHAFIKLNCAALPRELIESELFGHEKGAFTGAVQQRKGRFELAHQGTLFLDEIGDLPLEAQAKLLRVMQEREFERVGGSRSIVVDVRIVAATHRDLAAAVAAGQFRADLYYRLNVFPLTVPPLRARKDDLPALARGFLQRLAPRLGKIFTDLSDLALRRLQDYDWPGNVRELQNVIERAAILSPGPLIDIEPLGPEDGPSVAPPPSAASDATLEAVEREHILRVLDSTQGVIEGARGAAARLGLRPSTLRSRMQKLGIPRGGQRRKPMDR